LLVFLGGLMTGMWLARKEFQDYIDNKTLSKIVKILNTIDREYMTEVDKDTLVAKVINNLLRELDPYSQFMFNTEHQYVETFIEGGFSGIGIEFSVVRDTPVVTRVLHNSPAFAAGMMVGDYLIEADSFPICGDSLNVRDVVQRLRGKKGTTVNVKILRRGVDTPFTLTIRRDDIKVPGVVATILKDSILIMKIKNFSLGLRKEIERIIDKMHSNIKYVIIDLRDNAGGVMESAFSLTRFFLNKNDTICHIVRKNGKISTEIVDEDGMLSHVPLIVLVDKYSASASEIFASAIQENDRGIIIGEPTYGKSYFQEEFKIEELGYMRLSVGKYLTPLGRELTPLEESMKPYENHRVFLTGKLGRVMPSRGPVFPDISVKEKFIPHEIVDKLGEIGILSLSSEIYRKYHTTISKLQDEEIAYFLDTLNVNEFISKSEIPLKDTFFLNLLKAQVGYHIGGTYAYFYFYYRIDPVFHRAIEIIRNPDILTPQLREVLYLYRNKNSKSRFSI